MDDEQAWREAISADFVYTEKDKKDYDQYHKEYRENMLMTFEEARKKEAAERAAKAKRDKEELKAAMARDRAEVAARGPSQASVAKKLPTEAGGTMTSAIFQEQEEAEGRRNAQ